MADEEKIGRPWDDAELDAIVADYFAMLDAELAGRVYVKSHHSKALMEQIGRTHRSVEFKHQNLSAVLDELGMPWIAGYKPKRNYQMRFLMRSIAICPRMRAFMPDRLWRLAPRLRPQLSPARSFRRPCSKR